MPNLLSNSNHQTLDGLSKLELLTTDLHLPQCRPDGSFSPSQCDPRGDGSSCQCVDQAGMPLATLGKQLVFAGSRYLFWHTFENCHGTSPIPSFTRNVPIFFLGALDTGNDVDIRMYRGSHC